MPPSRKPRTQASENCHWCGLSAASKLLEALNIELYNQSLSFCPAQVSRANSLIDRLRGNIDIVNAAIDRLKDVTTTLRVHLEKQLSLVAPINRLPNETMLLVFQHLGDNPTPTHTCNAREYLSDHEIARQTPWFAAAVCRRWRSLALSHPPLWSRIEHRHHRDVLDILDDPFRLDLQLQRCGTAQLSVVLHCAPPGKDTDLCATALAFLQDYAPRIKYLNSMGFINYRQNNLPLGSSLALEHLQELRLTTHRGYSGLSHNSSEFTHPRLYGNVQRLTRCFFLGIEFDEPRFVDIVPLQGLKSLHLRNVRMDANDIFEALNLMPHLSFLRLGLKSFRDTELDEKHERRVPLLYLKSLCLHFDGAPYTRKIATHIEAPNLERFHMLFISSDDLEATLHSGNTGLRFQKCSSVAQFTIQNPYRGNYGRLLEGMLRNFPNVQRINVKSGPYFNIRPLLEPLVAPTDENTALQTICPQFQELHVKGGNVRVSFKLLQDLITSRARLESNDMAADQEIRCIRAVYLGDEVILLAEDGRPYPRRARDKPGRLVFPQKWLFDADRAGLVIYRNGSSVVGWDEDVEL